MNRVAALDGLRGLCVLLVLSLHFRLNNFGWIGVEAFFVLSGFLITEILLRQKTSGAFSFARFYRNRALRIVPAYFLYLVILAAGHFAFRLPAVLETYLPYLASFTFNFYPVHRFQADVNFYYHLWSLAVEMQFYLLWPFAVIYLSPKTLKMLIVILFAAAPIARWVVSQLGIRAWGYLPWGAADTAHWFTLSHADAFMAGAALVVFSLQKIRFKAQLTAAMFAVLAAAGILNYAHSAQQISFRFTLGIQLNSLENAQILWAYSLVTLCSAVLVLYLTSGDSEGIWLKKIFSSPVLVWIGERSYGIYIYHLAVQSLFVKYIPQTAYYDFKTLLWFGAYFAVVAAAAHISYDFFEKPFLRLKYSGAAVRAAA